nr:DUF3795 domain-containing protein [Candidatus Njordarchaeum guaymaensis]
MESESFKNVKSQIGPCGIWCGSCAAGSGATVELARRFEELAKKYELEKWVPKDFDFKEFMKGLASLQKMSVCPGCKEGGGNPNCKIRVCASSRQVDNCGRCGQLIECKNFESLERSNPKTKEVLVNDSRKSQKELIAEWLPVLKTKFPHAILFLD